MKNHLEISFMEFLNTCIKKWWELLVFAFIGMLLSLVFAMTLVVPVYEAHTTLFIGDEPDEEDDLRMTMQDFEVSQQLINDYKEILKTRRVAEKVLEAIDLDIPIEVLRYNMIIENIGTTRLFIIGYMDSDPVNAAEVANTFSEQLSIAITGIVGLENIQIIDEALVPEYPVGPSTVMLMVIGGFLGILFGMGFILYKLFSSKKRLQHAYEIEELLGLPVLAKIPGYKMEVRH
jgi:capsular polysaccharide biosynthesis protein